MISQRDLDEYHARINESRLCNNYVLARTCTKADCTYNHDEVAPNIVNVLRSVVRDKLKCSKRGDCRSILCYKGHGKNTFNSPNGLDEDEIEWVDADD